MCHNRSAILNLTISTKNLCLANKNFSRTECCRTRLCKIIVCYISSLYWNHYFEFSSSIIRKLNSLNQEKNWYLILYKFANFWKLSRFGFATLDMPFRILPIFSPNSCSVNPKYPITDFMSN